MINKNYSFFLKFSEIPNDQIQFDVHFVYDNMIKYRTDVTFGFLDLLVSFGGIAGLFLGCSLLSLVEIIYYLTFCLVMLAIKKIGWNGKKAPTKKKTSVLAIPKNEEKKPTKRKVSLWKFNNRSGPN